MDPNRDGFPSIETNLGYLELKYGYPEAEAEFGLGILDLMNLGNKDFEQGDFDVCFGSGNSNCQTSQNSSSSHVRVGFGLRNDDGSATGAKCYVRYIEPGGTNNASSTEYQIIVETDDC
ncbi:hypothetical protein [Thalassotalea agarivorans]|uniref:MSHA pilin protein MshA n=1 Tax=Thalassotalea agarivorans TaxID=349064 RepID=A0A1I0AGA0_THASX|nr:hypothetical protein [Thalassotalea agarivorans]SES93212.1 MSHA pilin protein MshA [Thalassotalea agarivorans]